MHGFSTGGQDPGRILRHHDPPSDPDECLVADLYDVARPLDDLSILYPNPSNPSELNSQRYKELKTKLEGYMSEKHRNKGKKGRNTWQGIQRGGEGEPFWRDPKGFDEALDMIIDRGREIYRMKWGIRECNLMNWGRKKGDEWLYKNEMDMRSRK